MCSENKSVNRVNASYFVGIGKALFSARFPTQFDGSVIFSVEKEKKKQERKTAGQSVFSFCLICGAIIHLDV